MEKIRHYPGAEDVNHERRWNEQDAVRLQRWWTDKMALVDIAAALERPVSEIVTRLVREGVLFYSDVTGAFHLVAPVITMAEIDKLDREMKR